MPQTSMHRSRRWSPPTIDQGRLEAVQWIALATMVIDHVGQFFLGSAIWTRAVGRVTFPLFALVFAWRFSDVLKRNPQRNLAPMFERLVGVGLLSEGLFRMITSPGHLNILFTFALAAALILLSLPQRRTPIVALPWPLRLALALALFALSGRYVDYEWSGVALVWSLFLYLHTGHVSALLAALGALGLMSIEFPIHAAILAAPLALLLVCVKAPRLSVRRPVRYLFYWIYPAHLVLIWIAIQLGVPRQGTDPRWFTQEPAFGYRTTMWPSPPKPLTKPPRPDQR